MGSISLKCRRDNRRLPYGEQPAIIRIVIDIVSDKGRILVETDSDQVE